MTEEDMRFFSIAKYYKLRRALAEGPAPLELIMMRKGIRDTAAARYTVPRDLQVMIDKGYVNLNNGVYSLVNHAD